MRVHLNIGLENIVPSPFLPEQMAFLAVAGQFNTCAMEVLPERWILETHRLEPTLAVTAIVEPFQEAHWIIKVIKIARTLQQISIAALPVREGEGVLIYADGAVSRSWFKGQYFYIPQEQA